MDGGGRRRPVPGAPVPSAGNARALLLGLHMYAVAVAPVCVLAPRTRYTMLASMTISAKTLTRARDRVRMSLASLQARRACWCAVPATPSSSATVSAVRAGCSTARPNSCPQRLTHRRWVLSRQVGGSPSIVSCSHSSAPGSAADVAATKYGPLPPPVASCLVYWDFDVFLTQLQHGAAHVHRRQPLPAVRIVPHRVHGEAAVVTVASHDLHRKLRPRLALSKSVPKGPALVIFARVRASLDSAYRPRPTVRTGLIWGADKRPPLPPAPFLLRLVAQWLQQVPRVC